MKRKTGRPRKFNTPQQMQEVIDAYFSLCEEERKPYTVEGLCIALEVDRKTFLNYEKLEGYEKFFSTVKMAKAKVAENLVTRGLTGASNSTLSIFLLKNNHGYQDKQEVKVTDRFDVEF